MSTPKTKIVTSRTLNCGEPEADRKNRIDIENIESLESIDWVFENGEKRTILRDQIDGLSPAIQLAAIVHGLCQKVADSYAGVKERAKVDEEGRSAVEIAVNTFDEYLDMIFEAGAWASDSKTRGPRIATLHSALVAALTAQEVHFDADALRVRLIGDEAWRKAVAESPEVKARVAKMQAEAAMKRAQEAAAAAEAAKASEDGEADNALSDLLG
jgi:hypothetical protein